MIPKLFLLIFLIVSVEQVKKSNAFEWFNLPTNQAVLNALNLHTKTNSTFLSHRSEEGKTRAFWKNSKRSNVENDTLCEIQLQGFNDGVTNGEIWALKMLDSWGKIPSGILNGNSVNLGTFDQCIELNEVHSNPEIGEVQGKYCLANINVDLSSLLPQNSNQQSSKLQGSLTELPTFLIGVCFPESCSPEYIDDVIRNAAETANIEILNELIIERASCTTGTHEPLKAVDWLALIIFSIFGLAMLTNTIYDVVMKYLGREPNSLFILFSVVTNGEKLFKISLKKSPDTIDCLNGIRCISIIWVAFAHAYYVTLITPFENPIYLAKWISNYYSMFIVSGTVSVDTFFLLSGLLVSWNVFKALDQSRGSINIPVMYLHRYLRLTPALAAAMLFTVSLQRFFGSGPFWYVISKSGKGCETSWWAALLYIQNYVYPNEMCIGHSWYLSVDMQLFILSPLIIIPLWKFGRKFIGVLPVICLLSISCTFSLYMIRDYSVQILKNIDSGNRRMASTYFATHARASAWIVGIILGYYLHLMKNKKISLSKATVLLGWISSLVVMLAVIFGPYRIQQVDSESSALENAFYESFSRISWTIGVSWIVFACAKGYGGLINDFLAHPLWQPLTKVTYSFYLVHLVAEMLISGSVRTLTHFNDYDTILKFWGYTGISMMVSILFVLAFESPIIGLEKLIFSSRRTVAANNVTESKEVLHQQHQQNELSKNGRIDNNNGKIV